MVHYSFVKVMTGHDLSIRRIPLMEIDSSMEGPVVVLTACMHGDEIGGTVVVQELFRTLKKALIRGRIVAFPMLNPFGFEVINRRISISNEDLNRSFPGNDKGTLAQRIAAIVMDKISDLKPDIVLDLHNDWNKSIPYIIIDPLQKDSQLDKLHHFASITGLPAIQETEHIPGAFSYNLNMKGIPALTMELGESLIINEKNVAFGISAVMSILSELGMTYRQTETMRIDLPARVKGRILNYSSRPLCSSSGIIRFNKKPGDLVRTGDRIARVYNAFGKLNETITSVHDGIILGHNDYAVAYPGSPVMAFGVFGQDQD